jgi:tetratricopeptide (TPR) repeat protein
MTVKYPFLVSFLRILTIGGSVLLLLLINATVIAQQSNRVQWLDSARALPHDKVMPIVRRGLQAADTPPGEKAGLQLLAGTVFSELARYDSALIYLNSATSGYLKTKDSTGVANSLYQAGLVHQLRTKYKEAITSQQRAFVYYQKTKNSDGAVKTLLSLGYSSFKIKKYPQAKDFYNQALERAQRTKSFELMVDAYDGLANVYEAQKDYRKAISSVRFMQGAYDSIVSRDHRKELAELENKYTAMVREKDSLLVIAEAQHSKARSERLLRLIERDDIRLTFYSVALGLTFVLLCFFGAWLITRQKARIAESRLRSEQSGIKIANEQFDLISQQVRGELTKEMNDAGESALLVRNMMDLMWLINPRNKSLESLIAYIREQMNATLKQSGVNYMIVVPDRIPNITLTSLERLNLYVVTRELVDHAVKCSKAAGLTLSITLEGRQMIFKVKANSPIGDDRLKPYREKMTQINGTLGVADEQVIYRIDLPRAGQS